MLMPAISLATVSSIAIAGLMLATKDDSAVDTKEVIGCPEPDLPCERVSLLARMRPNPTARLLQYGCQRLKTTVGWRRYSLNIL